MPGMQWMHIRKRLRWTYLQRMSASGWISKHGTDVGSGDAMITRAIETLDYKVISVIKK